MASANRATAGTLTPMAALTPVVSGGPLVVDCATDVEAGLVVKKHYGLGGRDSRDQTPATGYRTAGHTPSKRSK